MFSILNYNSIILKRSSYILQVQHLICFSINRVAIHIIIVMPCILHSLINISTSVSLVFIFSGHIQWFCFRIPLVHAGTLNRNEAKTDSFLTLSRSQTPCYRSLPLIALAALTTESSRFPPITKYQSVTLQMNKKYCSVSPCQFIMKESL